MSATDLAHEDDDDNDDDDCVDDDDKNDDDDDDHYERHNSFLCIPLSRHPLNIDRSDHIENSHWHQIID